MTTKSEQEANAQARAGVCSAVAERALTPQRDLLYSGWRDEPDRHCRRSDRPFVVALFDACGAMARLID